MRGAQRRSASIGPAPTTHILGRTWPPRPTTSRASRRSSARRPAPLHRLRHRDQAALRPTRTSAPELRERLGEPGEYPFTRGIHPDMYRGAALDDAPVRGLRHRAGDQRALPLPDRARLDRPLDGLRPAHAARPRLRRPALPRRGGAHRRGDRLDRRHAPRVRRHPARPGVHLDDDQRARRRAAPALRAGRRGAGRAGRGAARHHPERHPQGVHRARELHLPARCRRCA